MDSSSAGDGAAADDDWFGGGAGAATLDMRIELTFAEPSVSGSVTRQHPCPGGCWVVSIFRISIEIFLEIKSFP